MGISHLMVSTTDIAKTSKFYDTALEPLGYKRCYEHADGSVLGYKDTGGPSFWIQQVSDPAKVGSLHFAFDAKSEEEVKAFHAAAVAAGGKDNGAPGPRPQYTPTFYGAFVHDPEGNNIEAVYHSPTPYQ
ncbi:hypothetical protein NMY22_g1484 [Coprinellus aureogranulatus]|nr:hypothetical protein NMY22_g1484 [Coprinellus aureogranulatus]